MNLFRIYPICGQEKYWKKNKLVVDFKIEISEYIIIVK